MTLILSLLISCNTSVNKSKKEVIKNSYSLIWSDEFNQKDLKVDSSKWFMETFAPNNGSWYNNELQHYTDRIDNAFVSDGTLKIIAKKKNTLILAPHRIILQRD